MRLILPLAAGLLCTLAPAAAQQPPLTTIRDTVYRADGSPFNGVALIQWRSFQASNNANIGSQSLTVRIVNGQLYVRLTPTATTAGAYYQVRYNSDGQFQFTEFWAVPPSSLTLRLRDVRAQLLPGGVIVGGGNGGGVIGDVGGGGGGNVNFVDGFRPTQAPDGVRRRFTLNPPPNPISSLIVFRNGVYQTPGLDYTYLTGSTEIEFALTAAPQAGDLLEAFYRAGTSGGGSITLTEGSIPYVGTGGTLTQNTDRLRWFNDTRRLTVGNNSANGTLHVFDSSANAITQLNVRAGAAQGSVPMQFWFSNSGDPLTWINADGSITARGILSNTTSSRAGIADSGAATDPSSRANGALWYNTAVEARKSREASQDHALPQTICSAVGTSTASTTTVNLGTCSVPAALQRAGDRYEVLVDFVKSGSAGAVVEVLMGGVTLSTQTLTAGDSTNGHRISIGAASDLAAWQTQTVSSSAGGGVNLGQTSFSPGASPFTLQFRGRLTASGSNTLRVVNFSVVRYPNQTNP
jgi:hypothetical protein